jgi:hypothetical protein
MPVQRRVDIKNLVRELAENRVHALEILREALSNAKDHQARRVFIRTLRTQRNEVSVLVIDDGEGMNRERLEAFWGVGASADKKPPHIGYKGHGTKLYFDCERLTVATRADGDPGYSAYALDRPYRCEDLHVPDAPLTPGSPLHQELLRLGLLTHTGTAIFIEQLRASDASKLLSRLQVESYCDWFTVIGDIRSGLFDARLEFHQAIASAAPVLESLRLQDSDLRPLDVRLQINGERDYAPLWQGPQTKDQSYLLPWKEDLAQHRNQPALLAFGHRFADQYHSTSGARRVRDDNSAMRLTTPEDWYSEDGIALVARVEGHRRQRETYLEATWQGKPGGIYSFEERFGLWLCRDFVPILQRNDLLKRALDAAKVGRLKFDFNSLRNWQIFINSQHFLPTANRNEISNRTPLDQRMVELLVSILTRALKQPGFREWVERLRQAKLAGQREDEIAHMDQRRDDLVSWINNKNKKDAIDPLHVEGLPPLDPDTALPMRAPTSEQELFYVYGLLSARFDMPIRILEYDAHEGVDAIALIRPPELIQPRASHGRVEFKFEVTTGESINHFFDAIDAIVCWRVGHTGPIYEVGSSSEVGDLRKRKQPLLTPPMDTHEIVYTSRGQQRTLPVLQIATLLTRGPRKRP